MFNGWFTVINARICQDTRTNFYSNQRSSRIRFILPTAWFTCVEWNFKPQNGASICFKVQEKINWIQVIVYSFEEYLNFILLRYLYLFNIENFMSLSESEEGYRSMNHQLKLLKKSVKNKRFQRFMIWNMHTKGTILVRKQNLSNLLRSSQALLIAITPKCCPVFYQAMKHHRRENGDASSPDPCSAQTHPHQWVMTF